MFADLFIFFLIMLASFLGSVAGAFAVEAYLEHKCKKDNIWMGE